MDKFAWMGGFSGGGFRGNVSLDTVYNGVFKDVKAFNQKMKLLYVSIGTEEGQNAKRTYESLVNHGVKNTVYFESPGTAHEWLTWRRSLNDFAPRLFR
jgi:enterochelin esterase family protein